MDINKIQSASIKMGEKPGDDTVIIVNDVEEFRAKTQPEAIRFVLEHFGEPVTKENIAEFIALAKSAKKQRKPREKKQEEPKKPTFVGKLFTDKEGVNIFEVVSESPPTDWQFTVAVLRPSNVNPITLNLKEFKELTELVPKRSRKKEGK